MLIYLFFPVHQLFKSCYSCINSQYQEDGCEERVLEVLTTERLRQRRTKFMLRHGVMPGLHWVPDLLIFPGRGLTVVWPGHIKTPLHLTLPRWSLPRSAPPEYFVSARRERYLPQLSDINNNNKSLKVA